MLYPFFSFFFFFAETWEVVRYACSHRLADIPSPTESQGQSFGHACISDELQSANLGEEEFPSVTSSVPALMPS